MMSKLHNAEICLEQCRSTLASLGQHSAVRSLKGLEFHNIAAAKIALSIIQGTTVWGTAAKIAKEQAIATLMAAIQSPNPHGTN